MTVQITKEYRRQVYLRNKKNLLKGQKIYYKKNKKKVAITLKAYYEKNKDLWVEYSWKSNGIKNTNGTFFTLNDYKKELIKCNNECQICEISGKKTKLSVDHDHITGLFRGILCKKCNTSIAFFKEDIQIIENAVLYLESNGI